MALLELRWSLSLPGRPGAGSSVPLALTLPFWPHKMVQTHATLPLPHLESTFAPRSPDSSPGRTLEAKIGVKAALIFTEVSLTDIVRALGVLPSN